MLWKIIIVFLCAMALMAMLGKALFPERRRGMWRGARARRCPHCHRPLIGGEDCPTCGREA